MTAQFAHWMTQGRAAYPDITVDVAVLTAHATRHSLPDGAEHPHAADLYLACACSTGNAAAIAIFDREVMPVARIAAGRIDRSPDFADEIAQRIRERILVGEPPRITEYAGEGPLRAWVRIAAMRLAMNLRRDRRREVSVDDHALFELPASVSDARYQRACSDALRAAFAQLTPRERNLLRMHHLHGLTVDELAPTFGVHRATVARWIASARERVLEQTRATLLRELGAGDETLDSILRGLADKIDISIQRLLAE